MSEIQQLAPTKRKGAQIAIRPYFDDSVANMGLEKYGLALHDGVSHYEQLACLEKNGIKRYITGLDEFAPEVKLLPKEEREARVKMIRQTVAVLERELASNMIDPEDEKFWDKVMLLKSSMPITMDPKGNTVKCFWDEIYLNPGNDPVFLNPDDPHDVIKLIAIEAGGFSIVAKSLEEARNSPVPPKFYLDKYEETASMRTELKKLRNKALAELEKLEKQPNKLLLVSKVIDPNSVQYTNNTPKDIMYDNLDKYINGEGVEKNQRRAAESFIAAATLNVGVLKIKAIIKDASFHRFIAPKSDGYIYYMETNVMMGRTPLELVEFLNNPLNDQILNDLMRKVEKEWNN